MIRITSVLPLVVLIALSVFLTGCAMDESIVREPAMPQQAMSITPPAEPEGFAPDSLWSDQTPFGVLYSDPRACRVNDIVTVQIVETASAENSASTSSGKKSEITAGVPTLFGYEAELAGKVTNGFDTASLLSANLDKTMDASGKTVRSGKLVATVSARVTRVLPNGNLLIMGQREILINREKERIFVSGIIRREDIQSDNTILSTRIADARILYGGKGHISEDQTPGWASRIISVVWPF